MMILLKNITQNIKNISHSYTIATDCLTRGNIPFIPSKGSLFIWSDFSQYLKEISIQGEENLWLDIYKNTGVLLTPDIEFGHQKHGLFRIVFTAVSSAYLEIALNRIINYL